jgi:hypothetical protein
MTRLLVFDLHLPIAVRSFYLQSGKLPSEKINNKKVKDITI